MCHLQEIADAVQREAGKSHLNFDCFVCAILTHGERDIIYGVDGNKLLLDEIIAFVDGEKCPTLIDKPKIFFIQACQGSKLHSYSFHPSHITPHTESNCPSHFHIIPG